MTQPHWRLHIGHSATEAGALLITQHAPLSITAHSKRLLILPPLFEEMNRSRALLAALARELAALNVVTLLPELPGTGECGHMLEHIRWTDWLEAVRALVDAEKPDHIFTVRGGALLAQHLACPRDDFAPLSSGQMIWRALARARMMSEQEAGRRISQAELDALAAQGQTILCAGYALHPDMVQGLCAAHIHVPARHSWQLGHDGLEGPPVWLQAEPLAAPQLSKDLAALLWRSMQ